jgi:DNA ligase-1
MRLAIDGVFAEHEACSNVFWIKHKGTPVSIGSGFTAEQRLAYAKDPSLIVSATDPRISHHHTTTLRLHHDRFVCTASLRPVFGQLPLHRAVLMRPRPRQVGKEITVEYFSESEAAGRPGALSLRFPRVKKVWEGKRDV